MQGRKTLFLFFIVLMLTLCGNAQKIPKPDAVRAKRALLPLEQRWLQAEDDPAIQEKILADDFVHVLPSGMISKQDQLDFLRSRKRPADELQRHFEQLKVRIYGATGIVNGIVVATDKSGAPVRKTVFTDVFAYRNGRWQAVNSQENDYQPRGHR
ncbi:MAG TPA: nuclear transport factor 2 family protein [Candidatus Acidoferrales bacterium]|jgi:hypothetical protein|nr:nuclear transport factor 2 family protein [Candidatus Acidoferrales bacterium]